MGVGEREGLRGLVSVCVFLCESKGARGMYSFLQLKLISISLTSHIFLISFFSSLLFSPFILLPLFLTT